MHLHAKRHRFDACDSVTEALTLVDTFCCESRLGCFLLPCIVESLIDLSIVNFSLKTNSGLFSYWIKIAFIHGHTKPPNSLELSSYLPKEKKNSQCSCFIFLCYWNKLGANFLYQQAPILTCLSEYLLKFHNRFVCFHRLL